MRQYIGGMTFHMRLHVCLNCKNSNDFSRDAKQHICLLNWKHLPFGAQNSLQERLQKHQVLLGINLSNLTQII